MLCRVPPSYADETPSTPADVGGAAWSFRLTVSRPTAAPLRGVCPQLHNRRSPRFKRLHILVLRYKRLQAPPFHNCHLAQFPGYHLLPLYACYLWSPQLLPCVICPCRPITLAAPFLFRRILLGEEVQVSITGECSLSATLPAGPDSPG